VIITKLEIQKKDKDRVNVFIDGKFAVSLSLNEVISLGIQKNQEISPEFLNKIISQSDFGKLFNYALNFLSFRPRSEFEIRDALKRKTIILERTTGEKKDYQPVVDAVIEKLKSINQINDTEFAMWFVDQRNTFRPKGKIALQQELSRKKISKTVISEVLDKKKDDSDSPSQFELALSASRKKAALLALKIKDSKSLFEAKVKLQRHLASRGFDWDTIKSVVEKLLGKEYN
jgi:regulatory protein